MADQLERNCLVWPSRVSSFAGPNNGRRAIQESAFDRAATSRCNGYEANCRANEAGRAISRNIASSRSSGVIYGGGSSGNSNGSSWCCNSNCSAKIDQAQAAYCSRKRRHINLAKKNCSTIRGAADNEERGVPLGSPCCDALLVGNASTSHRLRSVGQQLIHLVQYDTVAQAAASDSQFQARFLSKSSFADRSRLSTIMSIYVKVLNLGPLELLMNAKNPIYNSYQFCILDSRQQVLEYIENLGGYCDSINLLRLILKSPAMINVMSVYGELIRQVPPTN